MEKYALENPISDKAHLKQQNITTRQRIFADRRCELDKGETDAEFSNDYCYYWTLF